MGRRGEFFDQDAEEDDSGAGSWGVPLPSGRGLFYDQDASMELPRLDPATVEQYERELDRRREAERARQPRPAGDRPASPPVRITSRSAPLYRPAPPPPPPPPPPQARPPQAPPPQVPAAQIPAARQPPAQRPVAPSRPARPPAPAPARSAPSTGRATAVLAFGTFASRLTGFLRVLVIGYVLGVGVLSDAFNYANGIPNIVYDLLVGGILSATLIPVFVELIRDDDPAEASRAISAVLTAITAVLAVVSALLWLAAPAVIHFYLLLSPGSTGGPEKALAARLLRYFAPQVFFLGATVASTALLNARRHFAVAAVSPVVNNLIAIAALLATKFTAEHVLTRKGASSTQTLHAFGADGRAVLVLGAGTTLGYAVQLLVQLPAMHRLGLRLRPVLDLRHPAVRRVAGLSTWLVGVVLANQASLALVMILAGRTDGGVTAYQFGYQFFQLPYALIAVSVASAIMPALAEHWNRDRVAFERQFVTGLRVTLAVLIPVAVVYAAVAGPFIELAIHHGAVGRSGAHLVTRTLVYFIVGLPGFSAFFLLMRAFQAMQDGKGMFRVYVVENALTVVAALALSPALGVPGLALAWAAPYSVASVYAVVRLHRRVGNLGGWLTIRALWRIVLASAGAAAVTFALGVPLHAAHGGDVLVLVRLVVQAGAGAAVYIWLARLLGIRELRPLLTMAGRLTGRGRP